MHGHILCNPPPLPPLSKFLCTPLVKKKIPLAISMPQTINKLVHMLICRLVAVCSVGYAQRPDPSPHSFSKYYVTPHSQLLWLPHFTCHKRKKWSVWLIMGLTLIWSWHASACMQWVLLATMYIAHNNLVSSKSVTMPIVKKATNNTKIIDIVITIIIPHVISKSVMLAMLLWSNIALMERNGWIGKGV